MIKPFPDPTDSTSPSKSTAATATSSCCSPASATCAIDTVLSRGGVGGELDGTQKPGVALVVIAAGVPGEVDVEGRRVEGRIEHAQAQTFGEGRDHAEGSRADQVGPRGDERGDAHVVDATDDLTFESLTREQRFDREGAVVGRPALGGAEGRRPLPVLRR